MTSLPPRRTGGRGTNKLRRRTAEAWLNWSRLGAAPIRKPAQHLDGGLSSAGQRPCELEYAEAFSRPRAAPRSPAKSKPRAGDPAACKY